MSTSAETSRPSSSAVSVQAAERNRLALVIKRAIDIVGSLVLLVLLAPLLLVIAIAIKLDAPGPILYKRRVIRRGGKPFMAFKFRSMVANADDLVKQNLTLLQQYQQNLKIVNDPRVTRVGRILRQTTLDELPQLINVLKGEMSLVGPRMLGDVELARFGEYGDKVLSVKPGMAGLWIASGRHTLSFERRVELEMEYIDRWSLWLDIEILLKSALAVIKMVGAE